MSHPTENTTPAPQRIARHIPLGVVEPERLNRFAALFRQEFGTGNGYFYQSLEQHNMGDSNLCLYEPVTVDLARLNALWQESAGAEA